MKLQALIDYLEAIAPPELQESYDNAGLIVGDPDAEVKGILVCLDSTEDVIREARAKRCNVVVAHHPIIFRGLKQITPAHYVQRTVRLAIEKDINIFAIHTNLDNVLTNGVNGKIAEKLHLNDCKVLQPMVNPTFSPSADPVSAGIGAGVIGSLPEEMGEMAFLDYLKKRMELKVVRHTPLLKKNVSTIAVCGGSGSFLIPAAIRENADVYITGDVKYHEFFEADGKILIADIGHYESERFTQDLLHELISEKFPKFAPLIAETNTNPITYY